MTRIYPTNHASSIHRAPNHSPIPGKGVCLLPKLCRDLASRLQVSKIQGIPHCFTKQMLMDLKAPQFGSTCLISSPYMVSTLQTFHAFCKLESMLFLVAFNPSIPLSPSGASSLGWDSHQLCHWLHDVSFSQSDVSSLLSKIHAACQTLSLYLVIL